MISSRGSGEAQRSNANSSENEKGLNSEPSFDGGVGRLRDKVARGRSQARSLRIFCPGCPVTVTYAEHPLEGYRRLTFMMLDADVVAVSPSSVWRVLQQAGLLSRWKGKPSRKGSGFEQPPHAHQHWHIDVSYINVSGTFY
jgi:hypothetical protein